MATTTPNFGWAVPTSTDLVKDGAVAIETLGDSIDASLVDLKGGTTGQVLAKTTGTDMDFTWTTPAAGSSYVAGKNFIINGGMDIWQRGTSIAFTSTRLYTTDRFQALQASGGNCTVSRQATGDTTNLPNIQYAARVGRDNGTTQTGAVYFAQTIETINSIPLAGQTVTVSFYARKGANFSATSDILNLVVATGTGTNENILAGFTGSATPISTTKTLTATWQKFSASATLASTTTEIGFYVYYNPTGTAGAADYLEITGVQLEEAASASDFSRAGGTIALELAACQRYFVNFGGSATYEHFCAGFAKNTTGTIHALSFPVEMRVAPTASVSAVGNFEVFAGVSTATCTNVTFGFIGKKTTSIEGTTTGLTALAGTVLLSNTTNARLIFSAEL